jgi:hypothetical protein
MRLDHQLLDGHGAARDEQAAHVKLESLVACALAVEDPHWGHDARRPAPIAPLGEGRRSLAQGESTEREPSAAARCGLAVSTLPSIQVVREWFRRGRAGPRRNAQFLSEPAAKPIGVVHAKHRVYPGVARSKFVKGYSFRL